MKRFEYKVLDVPARGFWSAGKINQHELSTKLNELGELGSEVVSPGVTTMWGSAAGIYFVLKREI